MNPNKTLNGQNYNSYSNIYVQLINSSTHLNGASPMSFNQRYTDGYQKRKTTYIYTVCEITVRFECPN